MAFVVARTAEGAAAIAKQWVRGRRGQDRVWSPRSSTQTTGVDPHQMCSHTSPCKGATCQPRASPWVLERIDIEALTGRNSRGLGSFGLSRPYRAPGNYHSFTQGVALGCHVDAPLGRNSIAHEQEDKPRSQGTCVEQRGVVPHPSLVRRMGHPFQEIEEWLS